jgi:2-(1,2-epoxy-1,2-dihydrophenyl)acetyl-CoA isomerase
MRLAAESATFSQSFVKVGLHPDWGGSFFLPRMVPPNIACEMFFLGDAMDARRALELGLVNRVVPDAELARRRASWPSACATRRTPPSPRPSAPST